MYVYCLGAIDDWDDWTPYVAEDQHKMREFAEFCFLAAKLGWPGDIREGPFAGTLRGRVRAIAFKEDNNGTTYVATDAPAPWLFAEYGGEDYVVWLPYRPPPAVHKRKLAAA